jgi:hypothetical protein
MSRALAVELLRARMLAVDNGAAVHVTFETGAGGCVREVRVGGLGESPESTVPILQQGLGETCLQHSGDALLVFNGRGMPRPPARSFVVSRGERADTLFLSIAGRIRRSH